MDMRDFNEMVEALSRAIDRKRNAETAKDGKAVLYYMKIYMEADEPYIRTAKFLCKIFSNASLENYEKYKRTDQVSDLFPAAKNIEKLMEAINLGIDFLEKRGWKILYFRDGVKCVFEKKYTIRTEVWHRIR